MKRVLAALVALLFLLPAFAQAAPRVQQAAKPAVCRAGSVQLRGGLCCPRSGVTRSGACVSGAMRPDIVPPPLAYCYGGASRDALGRCPTPACAHGYSLGRFGQCQRNVTCANGRTPSALGQCPPDIATPRVGSSRVCAGGGVAGADGNCPPLYLCSNGYAPVAGRCGRGAALTLTRPAPIARPVSLSAPAQLAPRLRTPIARPMAPQIRIAPIVARPEIAVPHISLAPVARPMAPAAPIIPLHAPGAPPPALAAPHP